MSEEQSVKDKDKSLYVSGCWEKTKKIELNLEDMASGEIMPENILITLLKHN